MAGRTDFRDRKVVTIDGEHARDFDDAISIEKLKNGHYLLGVHIADVAHYVHEGGALDTEAYERGTSVYFPERAVHMFPEALATGLCSLKPNVDRLVQSCLMEVTARGDVVRYEMHDGIIRSDARMTYTDVNAILTDRDPGDDGEVPRAGADVRADARAVRDPQRPPPPARLGGLRPAGSAGRAQRRRLHRRHRRVGAERRASPDRRVHAARERNGGGTPRIEGHAGALSHPRAARSAEGAAVRGVHQRVRVFARRGRELGDADALPEAGEEDPRQPGRAADRVPDAADHAEGALRPDERRATSAWRRRPTRISRRRSGAIPIWSCTGCCAKCGPPRSTTSGGPSSTRTCRKSAGTRPRWRSAPPTPSARSCSGRRSGSWPTRSATCSTATSPASRRSACSSS